MLHHPCPSIVTNPPTACAGIAVPGSRRGIGQQPPVPCPQSVRCDSAQSGGNQPAPFWHRLPAILFPLCWMQTALDNTRLEGIHIPTSTPSVSLSSPSHRVLPLTSSLHPRPTRLWTVPTLVAMDQ